MQLDLLILIRLAVKPTPRSDLARSLRRLVPVEGIADVLGARLEALAADGWVAQRPLRVTEAGRARALEAVRVNAMPTWEDVWRNRLPALALGQAVSRRELKAAFLTRRLLREFEGAEGPSRIGALTAIAGQILRMSQTELQLELVRQWVASEAPTTARPPRPHEPWTDADLVAAVHDAAALVPEAGRFGADRVFVSALWKQLDEGAGFAGLTLDGFKKRLLDANRTQQLTLARADLVAAMDRREVAASEIRSLNATFHFVLDRSRR